MANDISYSWEVLGKRSWNPDDIPGAQTYIECERGSYPGKAVLLFRPADAAIILSTAGPLTITVKKHERSTGNWAVTETITFQKYYPLSSRMLNSQGDALIEVTFADVRQMLTQVSVRKRFNLLTSLTPRQHDPTTKNESNLWTMAEIIEEILSLAPEFPELTFTETSTPENLVFDCTVAEAMEQLLATLGRAMVFNPLTGEVSFVDISSTSGGRTAIEAATASKRRIGNHFDSIAPSESEVTIDVAPWAPTKLDNSIRVLWPTSDEETSEPNSVLLRHFSDVVTGVSTKANAWYKVLTNPLDQVFQGIVSQAPSNTITHCRWWYSDGGTKSRFQNRLQKQIPWPLQPLAATGGGGLLLAKYELTQAMQIPTQNTSAAIIPLNGGPPGSSVRDSNSIAQWQANGDAGVAYWDSERWSVIFPWCVSP